MQSGLRLALLKPAALPVIYLPVSTPSGDTPGAKQRSITNKEGVNGAKH